MNIRSLLTPTSPFILLLALATGALNVFTFAPFNLWPLQFATLALVLWLALRAASTKRAALIGWAFGLGWIVASVHWLYISMHRYGGMPSWLAAIAVVVFGLVVGGFAALALAGTSWLQQRRSLSIAATSLLIFPSAWALTEWMRGWVLTGFPWVSSGYAHTTGPLAGFAPLVGVYGLAWIAALIAGALVLLPSKKLTAGLIAAVLLGGAAVKHVQWTELNGQPISVRLLQGNVPQEMKFEPEQIERTLALYYDMISAAPADLIATPETAIPMLSSYLPPDYLPLLSHFAQQSKSHLVLGIPMSDGPGNYANSVLGLAPQVAPFYRYDKHHLVPFGEFIPFGARWFVNMMQIPLGDFTSGKVVQIPFAVNGQWIMPNICYEDLFGEEIAAQLAASTYSGTPQATILLNVSNIGWFGDSIALPQHLQISQMRALETGRPMLRATNTGVTAVINPKGEVVAQLPPFQRGALSASVQGYKGLTPYSRFGNAIIVIWAILILGAAWLLSRGKDGKSHH